MTVNFQNISAASQFPGFKNYTIVSLTGSIPGQTLAAGHFAQTTISTPLNNTNAVSQVQLQYSGVNSNYFVIPGFQQYNPSGTYQIESLVYYVSGNINILTLVSNQTAGSITIPTITLNAVAFLFVSPV